MSTTLGRPVETSPRTAAVIAGTRYVLTFVLTIFANFLVLEKLVDPADAGDDCDRGTRRYLPVFAIEG